MSEKKRIFEKIGLDIDEANKCWDYDFVNDMEDFRDPAEILKEIISDKWLSIEQKVYLTWIYGSTLEKRKDIENINDNVR